MSRPSFNSAQQHRDAAPQSISVAIVTISDTRTAETDESGQYLFESVTAAGHQVVVREIVRDDAVQIRSTLVRLMRQAQVVLTTGGTGFAGRDVTIPVVESLLTKPIPGFGELFRMLSYGHVRGAAMLSQAVGGVGRGGTLLFALPGSLNAVKTGWESILSEEIGHLLYELHRQNQAEPEHEALFTDLPDTPTEPVAMPESVPSLGDMQMRITPAQTTETPTPAPQAQNHVSQSQATILGATPVASDLVAPTPSASLTTPTQNPTLSTAPDAQSLAAPLLEPEVPYLESSSIESSSVPSEAPESLLEQSLEPVRVLQASEPEMPTDLISPPSTTPEWTPAPLTAEAVQIVTPESEPAHAQSKPLSDDPWTTYNETTHNETSHDETSHEEYAPLPTQGTGLTQETGPTRESIPTQEVVTSDLQSEFTAPSPESEVTRIVYSAELESPVLESPITPTQPSPEVRTTSLSPRPTMFEAPDWDEPELPATFPSAEEVAPDLPVPTVNVASPVAVSAAVEQAVISAQSRPAYSEFSEVDAPKMVDPWNLEPEAQLTPTSTPTVGRHGAPAPVPSHSSNQVHDETHHYLASLEEYIKEPVDLSDMPLPGMPLPPKDPGFAPSGIKLGRHTQASGVSGRSARSIDERLREAAGTSTSSWETPRGRRNEK